MPDPIETRGMMRRDIEQEREILAHFENEGGSVSIFAERQPKEPTVGEDPYPRDEDHPLFGFTYVITPVRSGRDRRYYYDVMAWAGGPQEQMDEYLHERLETYGEAEVAVAQYAIRQAEILFAKQDEERKVKRGRVFVHMSRIAGEPPVVKYG